MWRKTKMNKFYLLLTVFAFTGLMIPTTAIQTEAASDLDFMLKIAEKAQKYIKVKIDEMENKNAQDWKNRQAVLEIYKKSIYETDQLSNAIENGDVKGNPQIICRLHPWSKLELFEKFSSIPSVKISCKFSSIARSESINSSNIDKVLRALSFN